MNPLRAILVSALVLTGIAILPAPAVEPSDYLMNLWTSDENLPDTSVTSVAQTPDGYLWIGTYNGLARFDGVRFTHLDPLNTPALKHARVHRLFTDPNGILWISTYDGSLTSFRDGVFTHEWQGARIEQLFSVSNRLYFASLARSIVTRTATVTGSNQWQSITLDPRWGARYFCQDAGGTLWGLLENGRLERIVGTNVVPLSDDAGLVGEKINCLAADLTGRVWVGSDKGILRWDGERFLNETPTNSEPAVAVNFLFCTTSNGVWAIAGNSVRLAVNRQWIAGTDSWSDLAKSNLFYIRAYEESNGNVWFRQNGGGLFCADANGDFSRFHSANGLPNNRVSCWFEDREGNLWVGLEYGGLLCLRQRQFKIVGDDSLKNIPVTTICEGCQDDIWFGTIDRGLNRWRNGKVEAFNLPVGAKRNSIFSACPDAQGRVWLSADLEDLYVFENDQIRRSSATNHRIKTILVDQQDQIWLGRQGQLICITNENAMPLGLKKGDSPPDVRAMTEDRHGNIWFGTATGLLYQFADGMFTAFKPEDSPINQAIWSLLPDDDGSVWAGTFRGGLLRFKDRRFTRYKTSDGLPSDVISQILDDGLGRLWFGSHKGIFYVPKASFAAMDRGEIQSLPCVSYGLLDGLPTLQCFGGFQPAACRSRDGRLWFATVKGLVVVDPRKVQMNQLPPPVVIENFSADGKKYDTTSAIKIPPGRHRLEFRFTALSFSQPDKVKFCYRLKGFDNSWSEANTLRSATFGPLPPGDYQFEVIACNNDGVWNKTGATLTLTQQPFYWQTWWFEFACIATGILTVAGVVSYALTRRLHRKLERLRQQHAIEHERERIAKDIHDDLGAGLTQIMLQSSLARRAPPDKLQTDLVQISETARDMVKTMDEIVWAVDPENDSLESLASYVGKYAQDYLTAASLWCQLDLPTELPDIVMSAEVRHHVFLAIKETLNNVVKHAKATDVLFQLQLKNGVIAFIIKDNGVGFVPGGTSSGNGASQSPLRIASGHGLRHLPRRLEAIGGTYVVSSEPGRGTSVEIHIPIRKPTATNLKPHE